MSTNLHLYFFFTFLLQLHTCAVLLTIKSTDVDKCAA